ISGCYKYCISQWNESGCGIVFYIIRDPGCIFYPANQSHAFCSELVNDKLFRAFSGLEKFSLPGGDKPRFLHVQPNTGYCFYFLWAVPDQDGEHRLPVQYPGQKPRSTQKESRDSKTKTGNSRESKIVDKADSRVNRIEF